jgi:hypothetical protein
VFTSVPVRFGKQLCQQQLRQYYPTLQWPASTLKFFHLRLLIKNTQDEKSVYQRALVLESFWFMNQSSIISKKNFNDKEDFFS